MWRYHHISVMMWSPAPEFDSQSKGVEGSKQAELSGRPVPQAHLERGGWLDVTGGSGPGLPESGTGALLCLAQD